MDNRFDDTYNNYSADYRNIYNKEASGVVVKGVCGIREKSVEKSLPTKKRADEGVNLNFIEENKTEDIITSNFIEENDKDELIPEVFNLIKISGRILGSMFIIILCVGLIALTIHLVNENPLGEEKNHFPYTLMCMLKNGKDTE